MSLNDCITKLLKFTYSKLFCSLSYQMAVIFTTVPHTRIMDKATSWQDHQPTVIARKRFM